MDAKEALLSHRIAQVGKDLKDHRVQPRPNHSTLTQTIMSLSTTSEQFLNTSRDSDSTTSLGSLFQCLTTLSVEKFLRTSEHIEIAQAVPIS